MYCLSCCCNPITLIKSANFPLTPGVNKAFLPTNFLISGYFLLYGLLSAMPGGGLSMTIPADQQFQK